MEKTKFDLTRAMVGEKVVTRDGQCPIYNGKTGNPLFTHAWILTNGTSFTTTDDGDWGNSTNHPLDLFMASEPKDKTDSTDDEVAKQHLLNIWPSVASEVEEKRLDPRVGTDEDIIHASQVFLKYIADTGNPMRAYYNPDLTFIEAVKWYKKRISESTPVGESQTPTMKRVIYNLQRIALADEEMVDSPNAARTYREICRNLLEEIGKI